MVGQKILHYEILEKLGAGGMGEIYKAQDTRLNRLVAIKALLGASTGDPESRRRFIQEAQAASSLNHPNIITIHDIVTHGNDQFMVMEYVKGKTLGEVTPQGGLGASATLRYAVQIADGLQAAHAVGIVHRDLKPGNIMVTDQGLVKILDFGLAKFTIPVADVSLTDATQTVGPAPMTVQGSILGTVSYMSPEQAQGAKVDARSDIFSFGCVLYEMVTSRQAFSETSPLLTLTAILRDEPRPIPDIVPGIPPELVQVIHRAMRKAPAQRYPSMQEMHAELAGLKQKSDSGILKVPLNISRSTRPMKPLRQPGRPITAVVLAFLLVACAGAWWWVTRGGSRQSVQTHATAPNPNAPPKPSAFTPAILNNQAILDMAQAKVPESVILGHIRSSPTNFTLSTAEIIRLTKGGVTEAVIQAMRDPSGTAKPPGADAPAAAQTRTVQLIGGLPFEIALTDDVPADSKPGQPLSFKATKDVTVGDTVVIAKGAAVTGVVVDAAKKKFLVKTTRPTFRLLEATAVDGTKLKVRASAGRLGESRKDPPLDALGGSRSKDALAPAGSRFLAYFDGDQTLTLRK
jgi:serine/threonine protein kinase